jgi:hypothetical protein
MAGALLLDPGAALAGGSTIEFPRSVVVGQLVTGSGVFGMGSQAPVGAGPWFAFLESEGQARSIPLGAVEISPSTGTVCCWRATITFTVPDVPTGSYFIPVRNAEGSGVGDLVGGGTVIAPTSSEGRLFLELRTARYRADVRRREIASLERNVEQLRADLDDRDATIDRQAGRLAEVVDAARVPVATVPAPDSPVAGWAWAIAALILTSTTTAAYVIGRRRASQVGEGRDHERAVGVGGVDQPEAEAAR